MPEKLLEVMELKKYFPVKSFLSRSREYVKAVDGIDFYIRKGETLGLVGESGCGKSTTGRTIVRLLEPTGGKVIFEGEDIITYDRKKLKNVWNKIQLIFQDPFASLNPRLTVGDALEEVLYVHNVKDHGERYKKAVELLEMVGLSSNYLTRFPHEFSGGQRQRIVIARALAVNPKLVICDEPVSALDVSIQAQVINLLEELQKELNLTYLFISHDLRVVKHISNRIAVMYLGKIVETAPSDEIFNNPAHPYSHALISAIPTVDLGTSGEKILLEGDVPSPVNPPIGCRFHTRCNYKKDICSQIEPEQKDLGGEHYVACHLY
ncbi:MAG: peptide/nickel transport system ATP-binding protein [Thermoanaerobacteraceae bacterium]|jgi:oligopeptide transport system ATP-binding protein|nr:peptide/nickel transport system ATP-binding protein [Thermoanaerobacteraceae bacterium]MDN5312266.1 peptide/nickel transport system ATP-binding protein [Thermoanaerobacteraceae bacterium]